MLFRYVRCTWTSPDLDRGGCRDWKRWITTEVLRFDDDDDDIDDDDDADGGGGDDGVIVGVVIVGGNSLRRDANMRLHPKQVPI